MKIKVLKKKQKIIGTTSKLNVKYKHKHNAYNLHNLNHFHNLNYFWNKSIHKIWKEYKSYLCKLWYFWLLKKFFSHLLYSFKLVFIARCDEYGIVKYRLLDETSI